MFGGRLVVSACFLILASCSPTSPDQRPAAANSVAGSAIPFAWPADLRIIGDGYPKAGDPCRRLGESALTVNYLDDSAMLVGCPGAASEAASTALVSGGGRIVGSAAGVTLISIPQGKANAGMPSN